MSVEVVMTHFDKNGCDLQIGASGATIAKAHVWYDIGDQLIRAQSQVGEDLGTMVVTSIVRISGKEFTFVGDGPDAYWTVYVKGCGCGGR